MEATPQKAFILLINICRIFYCKLWEERGRKHTLMQAMAVHGQREGFGERRNLKQDLEGKKFDFSRLNRFSRIIIFMNEVCETKEELPSDQSEEEDNIKVIYPKFTPDASCTTNNHDDCYHQLYREQEQHEFYPLHISQQNASLQSRAKPECFETILGQKNESALLNRHNSPSASQIRIISNQLTESEADLSYFWQLWTNPHREDFIAGVQFIVRPDNWPLFRFQFERPLELFLSVFESKIENASYLGELFPGLPTLIAKISAAVEYVPKKKPKTEEGQSMALYQHFIGEIDFKWRQKGAYYIRDDSNPKEPKKVPLGDFIAKSHILEGPAWADIFLRAGALKRQALEAGPFDNEEIQLENQKAKDNRAALRDRVQEGEVVLPVEDRLCCAQFFYFNYRICERIISALPLLAQRKFQLLWEVTEEEGPAELTAAMMDICALLNSGGGIILFDTYRSYLDLQPKGEIISKTKFEETLALFAGELRCIHPPVNINKEIFISFVPVLRNPITDGLPEKGRKYIEGLYILRIVVRPREELAEQVYFYTKQPDTPFKLSVLEGNATKVLTHTAATKFMKNRFAYYYISEKDYANAEELAMLRLNYSRFQSHDACLQPDAGIPKNVLAIRPPRGEVSQLEQQYKYVTLVVAHKDYHNTILQKMRAKGIQCELVVKYTKYKFKAALNSAALFHNMRFDLLINQVGYKKEFQFDGRFMLTILVTQFIKLIQRNAGHILPEEEFQTLEGWMRIEHPKETLKLWRFEEEGGRTEFYIQTQSKMSTIYMYYVLNHYNEKCSLKNPRHYQRMTQREKETRLVQYYPRLQYAK